MQTLATSTRAEFRIRLFQPTEDPVSARAYLEGQARALADFGVERTTSMELTWNDPSVHLVLVEGMNGEARGGVCVHRQSDSNSLPVARAVAGLEPRLRERIRWFARKGLAELCAGWASYKDRGAGLYAKAIRAAMAVMPSLSTPYGVGFGDARTLGLYESLGFAPDRTLGEDGAFAYPDDRYRSVVLWGDCSSLSRTAKEHKTRILELRRAMRRAGNRPFRLGAIQYDLILGRPVARARTA